MECEGCRNEALEGRHVCQSCLDYLLAPRPALASQPSDLKAKLESLRELSEKATAGPWKIEDALFGEHHNTYVAPYIESLAEPWENTMGIGAAKGFRTLAQVTGSTLKSSRDNAAFIVACVNAVRDILEGKD